MITDKMVDAAIMAASDFPGNWIFVPEEDRHAERKRMRAALEAADAAREDTQIATIRTVHTAAGMTEILEKQRQVRVLRPASPLNGGRDDK